jgi:hypothetical protein
MDHARFHPSQKKKESLNLLDASLPSYSLYLKAIEHFWPTMNPWIKQHFKHFERLFEFLILLFQCAISN